MNLTTGHVQNTNAHWLAGQLTEHGWTVKGIVTAPDSRNELIHRFQSEATRADLIISSGGLGPTSDDHTRHAFSSAFSIPLMEHQMAMNHLEAYCKRRQRTMTPEMTIMAMLPENSTINS